MSSSNKNSNINLNIQWTWTASMSIFAYYVATQHMNEWKPEKSHMMVVVAVCLRQHVFVWFTSSGFRICEHLFISCFFLLWNSHYLRLILWNTFQWPISHCLVHHSANFLSALLITVSICSFFSIHVPKTAKPFGDKHLSISSNIHLIRNFIP